MQQASETFSADPLLVVISAIVLAVTAFAVAAGVLKILPDALKDRANARRDPNANFSAIVWNNQQCFLILLALMCLSGFLLTSYGVLFIESLAVRSYFVRIPLFVAALSIAALLLNVARVRHKLRRHYFNLSDDARTDIKVTRKNTEEIKDKLND